MSVRPLLIVVMPSLRISGGNKEVVRLVQEITADGQTEAVIACMWKHSHEVDTGSIPVWHLLDAEPVASRALAQLPAIARAFRKLLASVRSGQPRPIYLLLGHYSTYLLAWIRPMLPRICFNQDMEWLFQPPGWRRVLLKHAILLTNRRSAVVTTNAFVTESYRQLNVQPVGEASIWAEARWLVPGLPPTRDLDIVMLLRESEIKRLDLYLEALRLFRQSGALRIAVITPDSAIPTMIPPDTAQVYLRPTDEEMQKLFARSRVFLLLSDVEGFGLPPLEAMGSGCVPACRDAGGVRCYMRDGFADLLFPLGTPVMQIVNTLMERMRNGELPDAATAQKAFASGLEASRATREECIVRLRTLIRSRTMHS